MGYTTDFEGRFNLNKPLTFAHAEYLNAFSYIRHMARDEKITQKLPDQRRLDVGLPVGSEACYYVGSADDSNYGQGESWGDKDLDVIDYNHPPANQPGLWCQWIPTKDLEGIEWDGNEKFYEYVEWLQYLVTHFLKPWGYELNGTVTYQGEDPNDFGKIVITNSMIEVKKGSRVYD